MAEISFKDVMLTDAQLDGSEPAPPVPEGLSDPSVLWPEVEVVASSFADSVVIHRMDDHDELIFLLMSRGQAYVRDADGLGGPRRLTPTELDDHLQAVPAGGLAAVPWSTPLKPGRTAAAGFLSLFEDPLFQRLARTGQVVAEYGSEASVMEGRPMAVVIGSQGKGLTKAILSALADHVGDRGAATALGQALGLRSPWARDADVATEAGCSLVRYHDALDVLEHPEPLVALAEAYGLDTMREYVRGFLALSARDTWQIEQASLRDFLDITSSLGIAMKPKAFLAYGIAQREVQGANAFDGAHWLDLWADTLAMQDIVHGSVDDKYPDALLATHDRLVREAVRVRHAIADSAPGAEASDPFEEHRRELDENSYEDDEFLIRPPRDVDEMLTEAREQGNCLAGYVRAFEHGDTDIYLMRRASAPEVPCVTVEVRDGNVRQALQRHNATMSSEQRAWLGRWCDAHGIRHDSPDHILGVGIQYRDGNARRHVDPVMAAREQDRRTNRPGLWRH